MHVPLSWLEEYLGELPDVAALTATLDDLGLVVEGIDHVGGNLDGLVVVRVEAIDPIEGADRIRLATVTDGATSVEVVCGAWNYEVGSLVPFAPVGTTLPNGMQIALRTMRGVVSNGMLCSRSELGIGEDHDGLLLLDGVEGAEPGRPLAEVLGILPDVVLDVSIEGNRPDAWCVEGIVRDLAARLGRRFTPIDPSPLEPSADDGGLRVAVEAPELCGRLTATVLDGIVVGPSPRWLARRLELCGMRPINNVVDASNYVMLELGQPSHPYDLSRLNGGLSARRARDGERLELLDGTELDLAVHSGALGDTGEDLVICDGDDTPIGLAGIKGGRSTGIDDATVAVALEAAWFEPLGVARSAKRHRLRTEASARFERGCDWANCERAARRFVELVRLSSPQARVVGQLIDVRGELPDAVVIDLDPGALTARLGIAIPTADVAALLEAIGFQVDARDDGLVVTAPTGRPDVRPAPFGAADLAEEVARLYGYARLPATVPSWPAPGSLGGIVRPRRVVRETLVGAGALEVWTETMVGERDGPMLGDDAERVRVANPMSADEPVLRSSLLPGMLRALRHNVERRQGDVALFEVGAVFAHPSVASVARIERGGPGGAELLKVPGEDERVCVLLGRDRDDARSAVAVWNALAQALRLEHVRLERLESDTAPMGVHATRFAHLVDASTRTVLGVVGEIDPGLIATSIPTLPDGRRLGWLDCSMARLADRTLAIRRSDAAVEPSRYPTSDVDLALVVDEAVNVDDVKDVLRGAAGELCESISCFDAYRGPGVPEGHRSLALRIRLRSTDRTLSEDELAAVRVAMIDAAAARLSATLR